MKLLAFTLVTMLVLQATAQDPGERCLVISVSGGINLPEDPGKNVLVSFLYTSTPTGTGVASSHIFQGLIGVGFPKVGYVGDFMNFTGASKHHAINGGLGLFKDGGPDDGCYLKAGYRWILPLHRYRIRLMPGVDLNGVLGNDVEVGRIDNKDQTLQVLGYSAAPQWTSTTYGRYGSTTETYNADHLSVLYRRNSLLLEPKIVTCTTWRRLVLGLEAGWIFQLVQGCVLLLQQEDANDGNRNTVAKIHEPRNGSMSGFYMALRIGMADR